MTGLEILAPILGSLSTAAEGTSLTYWFYVEGVGFFIALLYFYYVFVAGGRPLHERLVQWIDRVIIDDFYHKHLPGAVDSTYKKLFHKFETPVVDEGYNTKLVDGVLGVGRRFRRIQTGRINHYLIAFGLGLILFIALLFGMVV
jgi:NADH:ubiquinone oxidoreductase subunit 5 (subunit L)/multisubunit Na+/H+ antiporter MnhA subunit